MKTYMMTADETKGWESDDARTMDTSRRTIREAVRAMAFKHDEMHEIVSVDGVVLDVVYPSTTDAHAES